MEFLRQNAARIAAWLPLLVGLIGLVSLAGLVRMRRRGSRGSWFLQLVIFSVVALVVMLGPMSPLFSTSRRLESWRGDRAPDVAFRFVATGAGGSLGSLRGRVVLVNIWGTWCPPCRAEMPTLNRLQKAYAGRGVVVLTLTDERPDAARRFLERYAPDTLNGSGSLEWLPVKSFRPFTFIVDRRGVVRDYFFGAQEYAAFENAIRPHV